MTVKIVKPAGLGNPVLLHTLVFTVFLLAHTQAVSQGFCGADCGDVKALCADNYCVSSTCVDSGCSGDDCPNCFGTEGGVCTCPNGSKVYPDVCDIEGDCTVCTFLRRPSRPRDGGAWLDEQLIFQPLRGRYASKSSAANGEVGQSLDRKTTPVAAASGQIASKSKPRARESKLADGSSP